MKGRAVPQRGELWLADLDPTRGHEQAGRRPVLVLSAAAFNAASSLVTVLPITSKPRALPTRIAMNPPEGGVSVPSFVIGEQVRTISRARLSARLGQAQPATMQQVETIVRTLLAL